MCLDCASPRHRAFGQGVIAFALNRSSTESAELGDPDSPPDRPG